MLATGICLLLYALQCGLCFVLLMRSQLVAVVVSIDRRGAGSDQFSNFVFHESPFIFIKSKLLLLLEVFSHYFFHGLVWILEFSRSVHFIHSFHDRSLTHDRQAL